MQGPRFELLRLRDRLQCTVVVGGFQQFATLCEQRRDAAEPLLAFELLSTTALVLLSAPLFLLALGAQRRFGPCLQLGLRRPGGHLLLPLGCGLRRGLRRRATGERLVTKLRQVGKGWFQTF